MIAGDSLWLRSTPPSREATLGTGSGASRPRTSCDPRPPRGRRHGRRGRIVTRHMEHLLRSTPPSREATLPPVTASVVLVGAWLRSTPPSREATHC